MVFEPVLDLYILFVTKLVLVRPAPEPALVSNPDIVTVCPSTLSNTAEAGEGGPSSPYADTNV